MPMSNYGRVIHQAQVEQMTAVIGTVASKPGFDPQQWCAPITHFGQVLQEIEEGIPDEEISRRHPGWNGDALMICHKIVDGTISDPNEKLITEEEFARKERRRKQLDKERHAAYRRRYGKKGKVR